MMYWDSSWAWLWMTLMMVLFWGMVAFVIVALVRRPADELAQGSDARGILDARFARGEIDAAEYEQRRNILGDRARPPEPRR